MRTGSEQVGITWQDLARGRSLPGPLITKITSFLASKSSDDLVCTTSWFTAQDIADDATEILERIAIVGKDGAGGYLRRTDFEVDAATLQHNYDSILLCQTMHGDNAQLRFVLFDIGTGPGDTSTGIENSTLVCRKIDFVTLYEALGMGGSGGGIVWVGNHVVDRDRYLNFDDSVFMFPERFVSELINETVHFLEGEEAQKLRDWDVPAKRGILLYGKPGNGKTIASRICAKHALLANLNVVIIQGQRKSAFRSDSQFSGIGDELRRAASRGPALLLFEDIDLHVPSRPHRQSGVESREDRQRGALSEILDFLDGIEPTRGYVLLASTNFRERLDPALIRSGRIDREIEMASPNRSASAQVLHRYISTGPTPVLNLSVIEGVLARLPDCSYADLAEVARRFKIRAAFFPNDDLQMHLEFAIEELARDMKLVDDVELDEPDYS